MANEVFNKPVPQEALNYFNSKDLKIGFDYRDVWRAEHAYSFTVAKAMTVDILEDIQGAISKAIKEGKTFHQFQKELKPILQQKGWWGRKDMRDPLTSEIKDVQLGSPRRLKTIYRANMRTARGAGKWERIQRTKEALPYLLYQLGPSERHRPEHAAWNGIMLPADDPFWQTHFTPNGWGCKCWIRQISKNEYGRLKSRDEYSTTAPLINNEDWVNKRTGAVEKVPKGIHPGWDTNPAFVRQIRELKNGSVSNLFIASSTIKEAEKYLIDNDIVDAVDFGNIKDMALVNDWNKALYETIKEFPELRKNQYFTGSSQAQVKKLYELQIEKLTQKFIAMGLDPEEAARRVKKYKPKLKKVMGFAQSNADKEVGGITFNEAYEEGVEKLMRDAAELNYWAKGSGSMKYVVDHELGHQLDNLLLIRENKDVKSLFKKLKKENLLKTEVSIYAEENANNIKEFIAESWAEYRNAPIPRNPAKKVGDRIIKQYGDRFR